VTYCVDTSAFIEAGVRRYPVDVFPNLWREFDRLAHVGTVVSPEEVFYELRAKADEVHEWARNHRSIFVPLDGSQMVTTSKILSDFPKLVGRLDRRWDADVFVVALARERRLTVVTEEDFGTPDRPRIPIVCQHYNVPYLDTLSWIRALNLQF